MFNRAVRKAVLAIHVGSSVGAIGSIASFVPLAIIAVSTYSPEWKQGTFLAMEAIADCTIAPLLTLSLCSGVVQALGTPWGLFRHYWVVVKLIATALATAIFFFRLPLVHQGAVVAMMAGRPSDSLRFIGLQLLVHSSVGLLVLLGPFLLSIYKPKGLTKYGLHQQERSQAHIPAPQRAEDRQS